MTPEPGGSTTLDLLISASDLPPPLRTSPLVTKLLQLLLYLVVYFSGLLRLRSLPYVHLLLFIVCLALHLAPFFQSISIVRLYL